MKRLCMCFLLLIVVSSAVYAADFVPTVKMDIDVPDYVQYNFDGSSVDIPFTVSGTPARAYLVIETTGLAGELPYIRNGRIGWHTVQAIDTTVYVSAGLDFDTGSKVITWPGLNSDGNPVEEGEYTFYIWAYDYMNLDQPAVHLPMSNPCQQSGVLITKYDTNGVILPKPHFTQSYTSSSRIEALCGSPDPATVWVKWQLGNDPYNTELLETSVLEASPQQATESFRAQRKKPYDLSDFNYIYQWDSNFELNTEGFYKHKLVPNGFSEKVTDWGNDLQYTYVFDSYSCESGCVTDGTYLYAVGSIRNATDANPRIIIATVDGDKVGEPYLEEADKAEYIATHEGANRGGHPRTIQVDKDGLLYTGNNMCMRMLFSPMRYMESLEASDGVLAINEEGDGFMDKSNFPDAPFPDHCFANEGAWLYDTYPDDYHFTLVPTERGGPISFCLCTPDLTAVDNCSFAAETDEGSEGVMPIRTGGPFDGLYRDNQDAPIEGSETEFIPLSYIASDLARGTIGKDVPTDVAAAAPSAFAVEQSSPNPANPTTTISFNIPEAGNVNVEVFNVAGQKVDTLVNNFMDAGSHSVVWDGSNLASGVYFYSVTSGEFSKTMKMTLLK